MRHTAAENRRAHKERGGFRFGACSATMCDSPLFRVKTIRCHHAAPYEEITYMRDSRICSTNKKIIFIPHGIIPFGIIRTKGEKR